MPKIAIVGAGFSGLTLAWFLQKKSPGLEIEIFERSNKVGGMIQSQNRPILSESAAPSLLSNFWVEELFKDLNLKLLRAGYQNKSRWIYNQKPRKWPVPFFQTGKGLIRFLIRTLMSKTRPQIGESVAEWGEKNLNEVFVQKLISPAIAGIYGTGAENLSAALVLSGFIDRKLRPLRGKYKGSVSPVDGMGALLTGLYNHLLARNIRVHLSAQVSILELKKEFDSVVVATSVHEAAKLLKDICPEWSKSLKSVPMLSLASVTLGFSEIKNGPRGFGCLFPSGENFSSLGVLFNSDIFENRGPLVSETWILRDQNHLDDRGILDLIEKDRARLCKNILNPVFQNVVRWPQALPLYGKDLEKILGSDPLKILKEGARITNLPGAIYLTGNYLGAIGLGKILCYNQRLSDRIKMDLQI